MHIEVFGPGCAKCNTSARVAEEWMREHGLDGDVVKVTGLDEMAARGVLRTPAVFIDGAKVLEGRQLRAKDLERWRTTRGEADA